MASVETLIAKAIKKSDSSYFFENYSKQARAVQAALSKAGYKIVPKEASEDMIEAGVDGIPSGKVRPQDVAVGIYEAMVKAARVR